MQISDWLFEWISDPRSFQISGYACDSAWLSCFSDVAGSSRSSHTLMTHTLIFAHIDDVHIDDAHIDGTAHRYSHTLMTCVLINSLLRIFETSRDNDSSINKITGTIIQKVKVAAERWKDKQLRRASIVVESIVCIYCWKTRYFTLRKDFRVFCIFLMLHFPWIMFTRPLVIRV